ncbi:hypothetical protein Z517_02178 [Fonsecaea pedrosoi CBS 271.37]|uniref:Transcription factor domain-containing protein n=1 Tax=Fonsecaea pedrosoi CBS 271.37 TaxID=1442368 RepID=A0A0D2GWD6_9EURO|nr:uncharacterized protein Z517_02178 [Fonsecaea pedrosoi CBS 271.37]KIW82935.1 hypothetical protein Z517_02178 [Fonsecaea pedrosoi CBS 271.37]
MDGGDTEKAVMENIRRQTKESYRRRRSRGGSGAAARSRHARREIAPSTSKSISTSPSSPLRPPGGTSTSSPSSLWPQDKLTPPDHSTGLAQRHQSSIWGTGQDTLGAYLVARLARTEPQSPNSFDPLVVADRNYSVPTSPNTSLSTSSLPFDVQEINLVMYYLDHIFPRLSPYFQYYAGDTGRGWLLNLFLRNKPLCNAAVCLSACDKAQFVLGPLSDIPQPYHELEMQHLRSVADLRDHLDQVSKKTGASQVAAGVEALACIIHMIFFEVGFNSPLLLYISLCTKLTTFQLWIPRKGLMNDWVMHLDAASALLSSLDSSPSLMSETSPVSDISQSHEYPSPSQCNIPTELLSEGEKLAFDFFLDFYISCFITAVATLGLTPQSAQSIRRVRALCYQKPTRLWDRRGCDDTVMLTLLDIAILKDWRQRKSRSGTLSLRELTRRAEPIESLLHEGVAKFAATASPQSPAPARFSSCVDEEKRMVTNIYVNAALLFLHVVVSGFHPNIPEIRQGVLRTLDALEYMREHSSHNFPSWPYCVAGCLALESEYPRFRALVPPNEQGKHPLVLSIWTLEIIEECWRIRAAQKRQHLERGEESCDWVAAMNHLGTRLLLI